MSEDKDSNEQRGGGRGGDRPRKFNRYRRKFCRFCANSDMAIDYKQTDVLGRFVTSRGKILPRRVTGTCAKHQRRLAAAVRRARVLNLMPFKVQ